MLSLLDEIIIKPFILKIIISIRTTMNDVAAFRTSSWPILPLASVKPFNAASNEANTLIVTASALDDFAWRIHSTKWPKICSRCLFATRGNIRPNNVTDESMTATPRGRGPGNSSCYKRSELEYANNQRADGIKCFTVYLPQLKVYINSKDRVPKHQNQQRYWITAEEIENIYYRVSNH